MSKGRKPREINEPHYSLVCDESVGKRYVAITLHEPIDLFDPWEVRRLADWLHRAAEWIEGKEGE